MGQQDIKQIEITWNVTGTTRDEQIEINEYETQFSNKTELEEIENNIRNLSPTVLEERILMHADLTKNFRHFQILKLEPYDESEPLDVQKVPFLLSKTANLKRYYAGNFTSIIVPIWYSLYHRQLYIVS